MSATLAAAKVILEADSTLLATATGGVWDATELGRMGLNRTNAPAAFTSGVIKPCIVLKLRSSVPIDGIADDEAKVVAQREMLEAWFYQDSGFAAINTMRDRVFADLQGEQLGGFVCRWAFDSAQLHDIELDANVMRVDYAVHSLK